MRFKLTVVAAFAAMTALIVAGLAIGGGSNSSTMPMHMNHMAASRASAGDLRALLGKQLGQHAVLAMNATNAGVTGSKAFPAAAQALDQNSVALSKSIASVYGAKAGNTFLNGKFMWRAHIKFFVDYTVAKAKGNKAGQAKAVANLKTYTVKFGDFLAGATNLPKPAVRADLLAHVLQLKGQLDAYAGKNYAKAASLYSEAYNHMFMTGDLLAGAIAKQFPAKFPA
jgi:hypothetical protein